MNPANALRNMLRTIIPSVKVLPPEKAYKLWAPTYDRRDNNVVLFAEEREFFALLRSIDLRASSVVDIGCGTGRHIRHLLERGAAPVVGVDFSFEMLLQATLKFNDCNVQLTQAHMEEIPLQDDSFDLGIVSLALSHVQDIRPTLHEIKRLLKPGGKLLITDLHWSFNSRGWYRTFPTRGIRFRKFAVENFAHTAEEYEACFRGAGLEVDWYAEINIDDSARPFFEEARMSDVFEKTFGDPLLVSYRVHKL